MTFARGWRIACCLLIFFAAEIPFHAAVQSAPDASTHARAIAERGSHAYTLPPDKLAKAIVLGCIRNTVSVGGELWSLAVLWLLLASRAVAALEARLQRVTRLRWLQGLIFFALLLVITTLAGLPLNLFAHLVSLHYGISVQGWGSWFADRANALWITLAGAPFLLLFNWIVGIAPRRYWLWCWAATVPLMIFSVAGEPLLEPVFNHYEPLAQTHPALVTQLEKVVARTGTDIPPSRMFLMNASAKTNGLNAYVSGLGATKRIVVWDTTAGRIPDDEILFIFAHESGHYVLNHIPQGLAAGAVGLFFIYWGCAGFAAWLLRRFGARWGTDSLSTRTGFIVLLFTVSLATFLLEPVSNAVSRHFEHQADVYGQEAIHGIVADPQRTAVAAFNAIGAAWLEDPDPSPFIEFWLYNHPSTRSRADFAAHYDPWTDGGHGKFFQK